MSTRIKSAAVAIVIAVILLIAHGTFLFNIAVGAISALAIYEILFENLSRAIVINEAIELSKKLASDGAPKFINAILDQIKIEK